MHPLHLDGPSVVAREATGLKTLALENLESLDRRSGVVFAAEGSFDPEVVPLDSKHRGSPFAAYALGTLIASLDVDLELGTVAVRSIACAFDTGKAINPTLVQGQIHGGIAQGLGLALMEEFVPGRTENLHDYLIPTAADMPEIETFIVEDANPSGPYGAKGVGEGGSMPEVDLFLSEVVSTTLASVAEEMSLIVMRAARSPALREAGGLSSVLTDAKGNLIAQGRDLPIHIGVMSQTIPSLLEVVGHHNLRPGDIWILNLPLIGGNHLPDVKLVRPIFAEDTLVAFALSLAHWADVGGASPGSYFIEAADRWQEGLNIPPVRLARNDELVDDILAMIKANVRGADEREGDLMAQVAAVRTAERRVAELIARIGLAPFQASVGHVLAEADTAARAVLASIPDGRYHGEDFLDPVTVGGAKIRVAVEVTIEGDEAVFDFSASEDAVLAPVNTTPSVAASAVDFVVKMIAGGDAEICGPALGPVRIVVRPGSVLLPSGGEPVAAGNHETSQRVVDAILNAFRAVIPERLCAGGCGTAGLMILSAKRYDGTWWTLYETHGGGEGANAGRAGQDATRVYLSNMMNTPAEFIEAEYPVKVLASRVRRGSGGDGLVREYLILGDEARMTITCERGATAPAGLLGGESGLPSEIVLVRDGVETRLPSYWSGPVRRGDVVRFATPGGGGYGRAKPDA